MAYRNSESDIGRKGAPGTKSRDKADDGTYQYVMPYTKAHWMPAYSGGMGECAEEVDPGFNTVDEEVGNDADQDRLTGY